MARVKFSPIISEVRGKLGNVVFQGSKSGIAIREKKNPRNPRSKKQIQSRARLAIVKSTWQTLTATNLNSWISFAQFFQKKTKNDQTKVLTPYELFIQHNTVRNLSGIDILENTTLFTNTIDQFIITSILVPNVSISIDVEVISPSTQIYTAVYFSRPFRASAAIAKSEVRFMTTEPSDTFTKDITTEYLDAFKRLPSVGEKVLVKMVSFAQNSGWISRNDFQEIIF